MPVLFSSLAPKGAISPMSIESMSVLTSSATPASAVWPAANRAIYVPFRVYTTIVVSKMFCINGAAVSGNLDLGIYSADGTRLVSKGSTAQAGTSQKQEVTITSTELFPGLYFMAMAMDNGTGTTFRKSTNLQLLRTFGMFQQATAFALPATATFAAVASSYIPIFGIKL